MMHVFVRTSWYPVMSVWKYETRSTHWGCHRRWRSLQSLSGYYSHADARDTAAPRLLQRHLLYTDTLRRRP